MVINDPVFFLSHRKDIATKSLEEGYDVYIATGPGDAIKEIESLGLKHHLLPLNRSGTNPINEIKSIYSLFKLITKIKPSICHFVTIKPVIYGGFVTRLSPVKGVVFAISGLGSSFTGDGFKSSILLSIVKLMYRFALNQQNSRVIFQNNNDKSILLDSKVVKEKNSVLIKGSGVELAKYSYTLASENSSITVVMACRLLKEKGVFEFIQAAEILKSRNLDINFKLIGEIDLGNPKTVTAFEIETWKKDSSVDIMGFCDDMPTQIKNSDIVVLPSYYGEGLPKVLIEAAACGRAVITTDHPGCRDAILPNETGLLIPIKSPEALADAIYKLYTNPDLRIRMGERGRLLAEQEFDVISVVKKHLEIYDELLESLNV